MAWLGLGHTSGTTQCQAMVHPDATQLCEPLAELALHHAGRCQWLVSCYQELLAGSLQQKGLVETNAYSLLVRTVMAAVEDRAWTATEVAR